MSHIKVPSPEQVYKGAIPTLPEAPKIEPGLRNATDPATGHPEPYLDILVTASSNFSTTHTKGRSKPAFSSRASEDYVFIPDLRHTGLQTSLLDPASPIGDKVQLAVKTVYPKDEQKQFMDSKLMDLAKPVTTVTTSLNRFSSGPGSPGSLSPSQRRVLARTLSHKRNVVLTNTSTLEDPYVDSGGRVTRPTKVHELVYNRRAMMPHSRRKERFAKDILRDMKREEEEAKMRMGY
mmetsp:Transcript_27579/g.55135  ORF Transcript_27579/g.55135 Transcript_27579/m.55135 type:complete len:235 (+) Transcript_27579:48-752(+)